jgi:hypothetical protein
MAVPLVQFEKGWNASGNLNWSIVAQGKGSTTWAISSFVEAKATSREGTRPPPCCCDVSVSTGHIAQIRWRSNARTVEIYSEQIRASVTGEEILDMSYVTTARGIAVADEPNGLKGLYFDGEATVNITRASKAMDERKPCKCRLKLVTLKPSKSHAKIAELSIIVVGARPESTTTTFALGMLADDKSSESSLVAGIANGKHDYVEEQTQRARSKASKIASGDGGDPSSSGGGRLNYSGEENIVKGVGADELHMLLTTAMLSIEKKMQNMCRGLEIRLGTRLEVVERRVADLDSKITYLGEQPKEVSDGKLSDGDGSNPEKWGWNEIKNWIRTIPFSEDHTKTLELIGVGDLDSLLALTEADLEEEELGMNAEDRALLLDGILELNTGQLKIASLH